MIIHIRPEKVGGYNNFKRIYMLCLTAIENGNNIYIEFKDVTDKTSTNVLDVKMILIDAKP